MSLYKTFVCLAVFVLALGIGSEADGQDGGEIINTVVDDGRETRLLSEPGGEREDSEGCLEIVTVASPVVVMPAKGDKSNPYTA